MRTLFDLSKEANLAILFSSSTGRGIFRSMRTLLGDRESEVFLAGNVVIYPDTYSGYLFMLYDLENDDVNSLKRIFASSDRSMLKLIEDNESNPDLLRLVARSLLQRFTIERSSTYPDLFVHFTEAIKSYGINYVRACEAFYEVIWKVLIHAPSDLSLIVNCADINSLVGPEQAKEYILRKKKVEDPLFNDLSLIKTLNELYSGYN